MRRHDVIVVGTGLAGLTAATRLAEAGMKVQVLAKGVGATHLSGATIDVLGYDPDRVASPQEALGRLGSEHPDHPYAVIGVDAVAAALEWFRERVAHGSLAPYAYTGDLAENFLLPTALGVAKPSAMVPVTMAAGDLRDDTPICVVGFRALKDFHAHLLADNLSRGNRVAARGFELDLVPEGRADVNALGFARAFDDALFRARVISQLAGRLHARERVAFPAILGIADPHGAWSDMQRRLGHPVFEVPTLPPSVPGMRVFATLREALRRAGGSVILNAVVTGGEAHGDRLEALNVRLGLNQVVHRADWVVLATGGFASGGLELDSHWTARETALGLPVAGVPERGSERFRAQYFDAHPIARAGVAVDAELRPCDATGSRIYDNVLVAGATLAGAEPWREKSGDGLSLATGHRAAELILAGASAGRREATAAGRG